MTTFNTLRAANQARQGEWDEDNSIDLSYRGNELAGEVGEACNVIKKLERERRGIRGSRATIDELADELADAAICLDLIAMAAGIDLESAVATKFNKTSTKYCLETKMACPRPRLRFRHLKRGGAYAVLADGVLQTAKPIADGTVVRIYQSADGRYWCRPSDEFLDGRFEEIRDDHPEA